MKNSKLYNYLDRASVVFVDCDAELKEYNYNLLLHYPESSFFSCDISVNNNEHYEPLQKLVRAGLIVELKYPLYKNNGSLTGVASRYYYRWDMNYEMFENIDSNFNEILEIQ